MFLQQPQAPPADVSPLVRFLNEHPSSIFIVVIGIFYLIVFLPAQRQRKRLQEMVDNLKAGDKVITSGGIYGTIAGIKDDRIQLRVAENVKIELSRNAVTALQGAEKE